MVNGLQMEPVIVTCEHGIEDGGHTLSLIHISIKPLDVEAVQACIDETGKIITVEDHNILNGLGSAVADVVAESGRAVLRRVGIQDQFGMSASYDCLLAMNGITAEDVYKRQERLHFSGERTKGIRTAPAKDLHGLRHRGLFAGIQSKIPGSFEEARV